MDFKISSKFQPTGDQPEAIRQLTDGVMNGEHAQVLLGVTGSGKTFTMANVIANVGRPTLILSHNKTLAAQLYEEMKSFFPDNAVEYYVSYYDYYQPEAYLPSSDTYIEKDLAINEDIDKLRLSAVSALLSGRKDVVVVSSVSCIYGMGGPTAMANSVISVKKGETYGLVGESGCGKSTVGRLIAGLEPPSGGAIELDGRDLATLKGRDAVRIHRDVQMMFQDSYAAMDPRMRIDQILAEPMSIQKTGNARQIAERIMEILEQVGLTEEILDRYPHEFSGGQLQRIGFARSLTLAPDLIVADEPVSALDVSVQAQVLNLMKDLQQELGLSYLFISHDLAVVQYMADRIGVMYLGRIVEEGPAHEVVKNPKHPYTKALIDSIPVPDPEFVHDESAIKLTGEPPSAVNPPEGCRFRPRCPFAGEECKVQPMLTDETHRVACHHPLLTLGVKEEVNA